MFQPSNASFCGCFDCSGMLGDSSFQFMDQDEDSYGDAASSGSGFSQNGWPASSDPKAINIVTVAVPLKAGNKTMQVAARAVGPLLAMVTWWDANIEPVTQLGGYNFRVIRGISTVISNHGSGTAIDINATKHYLGARGTVTAAQAIKIAAKAASLGLRWGGSYVGRADEMHVEIASSKAAALAAAAAGNARRGLPLMGILALGVVGWYGYKELKRRGMLPLRRRNPLFDDDDGVPKKVVWYPYTVECGCGAFIAHKQTTDPRMAGRISHSFCPACARKVDQEIAELRKRRNPGRNRSRYGHGHRSRGRRG